MSSYKTDLDQLYEEDPIRANRVEFLRLVRKEDPELFERFKRGEMGPERDWAREEASNWDRRAMVRGSRLVIFSEEDTRARRLAGRERPARTQEVRQHRYRNVERDFPILLRQLQGKTRHEIAAEFTDKNGEPLDIRVVDRHLRNAKRRLGLA